MQAPGPYCGRYRLKFIVDSMHGSLARWLRILGHEVTYLKDADDPQILSKLSSGTVLLTSDLQLFRTACVRGLPAHLVKGEGLSDKLSRMALALGLSLEIDLDKSKCPTCGEGIRAIDKSTARDRIPPRTYSRYYEFWECTSPNCRKIYWQGAHWKRIRQTLDRAQSLRGKH